ncbi:class I SAM-dependent methyltransferase [Halorientalis salina]|uniref:class I SAM-dependent methyltransferase n=1 Tax=Halorientalis salina TaxID=2932266 RepID=UPI0010ABAE16|nr:methyltransferase domain-containing protein [Halorientalis salina]
MAKPDHATDGTRTGDVSVFDRFSPLYDRFKPATDRSKLDAGLDRADREIERVLDVGGGSGQGVRALDVSEGIVADAAPGMLRRARRRGLDAVGADAGTLPLTDESVDAVLILDALHHMRGPEAVVGEAARVLRPGGVLVILEFDPTTVLGRALVAGEHLVGMDSAFFAPGDLEAMVRAAGLDASVPRTGFEYTVVGRKRRGE